MTRKTRISLLAVLVLLLVVACTQLTLFVTQPIPTAPEGSTLVMLRTDRTRFIDSADGVCLRQYGAVSVFCRLAIVGETNLQGVVLLRLPFSQTLYDISTGGRRYAE